MLESNYWAGVLLGTSAGGTDSGAGTAGTVVLGTSTTDWPDSLTLTQLKKIQLAARKAAHHIVALKRKVVPPLLPNTPWFEEVKKLPPLEG